MVSPAHEDNTWYKATVLGIGGTGSHFKELHPKTEIPTCRMVSTECIWIHYDGYGSQFDAGVPRNDRFIRQRPGPAPPSPVLPPPPPPPLPTPSRPPPSRPTNTSECNLAARSVQLNAMCCNADPTHSCKSGMPSTCVAECASTFLPFWSDCRAVLLRGVKHETSILHDYLKFQMKCVATAKACAVVKGGQPWCHNGGVCLAAPTGLSDNQHRRYMQSMEGAEKAAFECHCKSGFDGHDCSRFQNGGSSGHRRQ